MMNWLKQLFGIKQPNNSAESPNTLDMRVTPVDNPLDYREDGSIQPGDPAYEVFLESFLSGEPMISTQRPDGRWETRTLSK